MSCPSKVCNPRSGGVSVSPEVKAGCKDLILDNTQLKKTMDLFMDNIERGLKKATHESAAVKCYPTYVQDLPTGKEVGDFLALDLGGTNFRVLLVSLEAGNCNMKNEIYAIPTELMTGTSDDLFDHIAKCLSDFVTKQGIADKVLPLGFTFSFPLSQKGLRSGILMLWTKGFNIPEAVGKDVVVLLQEALNRIGGVKIDVCAVLNDTTGTLMSCAWKNQDCRIGLIVGTGHNGCYVESQANAELFDEPDMGSGKVIINLEAAAFGNDGCLDFFRTDIDKKIDAESINPGFQIFEKLISGMFLGEMVRYYTLKFIDSGVMFAGKDKLINPGGMFGGKPKDIFGKKEVFETAYISDVETDVGNSFTKTKEVLSKIGINDASEQDMINLRYICHTISTRSANLVAAASCTLVKKVGEPKITIGIDGTVYKCHPLFKQLMKAKMDELIDPGFQFQLMLSEDGSGRGAALVAAMAAIKARAGA